MEGDPKGLSELRLRINRACTSSRLILVLGNRTWCRSFPLASSRRGDPVRRLGDADLETGEAEANREGGLRGEPDRLRRSNPTMEPELRCSAALEGEAERDGGI